MTGTGTGSGPGTGPGPGTCPGTSPGTGPGPGPMTFSAYKTKRRRDLNLADKQTNLQEKEQVRLKQALWSCFTEYFSNL